MFKRLLTILITTLICFNLSTVGYCSERIATNQTTAEKLKLLGVFVGNENGFELEREPTRLEGAIMLVRLLGAEQEAMQNNYSHPFKDVPSWASFYIGYMHHYSLTTGVGNNNYGSDIKIDARSYLTFVLRALEYNDSKGDFKWENAISKAYEIGLINKEYMSLLEKSLFIRDDIARISYDALSVNVKSENKSLLKKLVDNNAISENTVTDIGLSHVLNKEPLSTINISNYRIEAFPVIDYTIHRDTLPQNMRDFKYFMSKGTKIINNEEAYEFELLANERPLSIVGSDGVISNSYYKDGAMIALLDDNKKTIRLCSNKPCTPRGDC